MSTWMIVSPFYSQESYIPSLREFLNSCEDPHEPCDNASSEMKILKTLDFDINIPTAYHFLRRYTTVTGLGWGNKA